ncbi:MAG: sensor histidine kinase [Pseudomonadota bacterium]
MASTEHTEPDRGAAHPLEIIAVFRRWPPSALRDIVYTFVWNSLIAFAVLAAYCIFDDLSLASGWWPFLLISNIIGFLIHTSLTMLERVLRGWPSRARGWRRTAYTIAVCGACVMVGTVVGIALLRGANPLRYFANAAMLWQILPSAAITAAVILLVLGAGERRLRNEATLARHQEQVAQTARLLAETRLRALQAQIEPHFLYNTLATVVSLIESDPQQARHMLERFIDFLRASLTASRAELSTLGQEAALVRAYLDVQAVRMGARLRYQIEIEPALAAMQVAPLLLQPVVENAIIHGLEPKVEGGQIVVHARADGDMVCLEVRDSGVGVQGAPPSAGSGVGMGHLRERLQGMYGAAARVQLLENPDGGVTVRILLPRTLPPLNPRPPSTTPAPSSPTTNSTWPTT